MTAFGLNHACCQILNAGSACPQERIVRWRAAVPAETLGQERISEAAINHRGGEPHDLPPPLEGHKRLDGPSGGEFSNICIAVSFIFYLR